MREYCQVQLLPTVCTSAFQVHTWNQPSIADWQAMYTGKRSKITCMYPDQHTLARPWAYGSPLAFDTHADALNWTTATMGRIEVGGIYNIRGIGDVPR